MIAVALLADVPVDVGRDEARGAAARELADPIYDAAEPSWLERVMAWLLERFGDLVSALFEVTPGGAFGLIVLLVLAVVIAVVVRLRMGKVARTARAGKAVFGERVRTAAEHRDAAEAALARGDVDSAVAERFRAIAREFEERGVLRQIAGMTADEIAAAAGGPLPGCAEDLRRAARAFDDVYYGGHAATVETYRFLCTVDDRVRVERPMLAEVR